MGMTYIGDWNYFIFNTETGEVVDGWARVVYE